MGEVILAVLAVVIGGGALIWAFLIVLISLYTDMKESKEEEEDE